MFKMRLSKKLPALILGSALLVGGGIGLASYFTSASSVQSLSQARLNTAANTAQKEFHDYLKRIDTEIRSVAGNPLTISAIKEFSGAWNAWTMFGGSPLEELQRNYITNNPHPAGKKHLLDTADTGVHYDTVHATYHSFYRSLMETGGYYDIFLFDTKGNLVYSVFKELDFATNFAEGGGEWAGTDLGVVFRNALAQDSIVFEDFAPYGPSADAPASFIAYPVRDANGSAIGVLAFQMPVDRINSAFKNKEVGLGASGEVAVVGRDGYLRNDSARTTDVDDILVTKADAPFVDEAFTNGTSTGVAQLYRDEPMSVTLQSFDFNGSQFAVIAMESVAEGFAPVAALRNTMAMIGIALLAIVALVGSFAARSITRPIGALVSDMTELSNGKTEVELAGSERPDEIGDMTRAVVVFRDNILERQRLAAESEEVDAERLRRQERVDSLIETFRADINSGLNAVAQNATSMTDTAQLLTQIAEGTNGQATSAAAASHEAAVNVQTVAAAAEELAASIGEIGRQVENTTTIVGNAATHASSTNEKVEKLAEAANRIGDVVNLIQDIAEQTNLLALNATIEAARAGDAGKGFAVVASEVKQLANQTAKATDEISSQISAIQGSTGDTVSAINEIAKTMTEVDEFMGAIASSVEQQGSATREITENVSQAAAGTDSVVENIGGVTSATTETAQSAAQVNEAATTVNNETDRLNTTIAKFLDDVAAA